jgi:ABC-2 type transport system permease protein
VSATLLTGPASIVSRAAALQIRESLSQPLTLSVGVVQPAAFLALVLIVNPTDDPAVIFGYAVAVALLGLWAVSVFASGSILFQDRAEGTLSAVLLGTSRPFAVLMGRSVGAMLAGAGSIIASLLVVLVLLQAMPRADWGLMSLAAVIVVVSSGSIGLLLSSLFILTRVAGRIAEALLYPIFVASGILIPLEVLPPLAALPARGFSLYWGNLLLVAAADGRIDGPALAALLMLSVLYGVIGYAVFRRVVARGRARGDLDVL